MTLSRLYVCSLRRLICVVEGCVCECVCGGGGGGEAWHGGRAGDAAFRLLFSISTHLYSACTNYQSQELPRTS